MHFSSVFVKESVKYVEVEGMRKRDYHGPSDPKVYSCDGTENKKFGLNNELWCVLNYFNMRIYDYVQSMRVKLLLQNVFYLLLPGTATTES